MKNLKLAKVSMTTDYQELLNAEVIPILSVNVDEQGNHEIIRYAENQLKNHV